MHFDEAISTYVMEIASSKASLLAMTCQIR